VSGEELITELQYIGIIFEGNFAHGRSDGRATSMALDEASHFVGHATFKRRHPEAAEIGCCSHRRPREGKRQKDKVKSFMKWEFLTLPFSFSLFTSLLRRPRRI
jgi:hypothetical protein